MPSKKCSRLLSLVLAVMMVFTAFPVTAFAEDIAAEETGVLEFAGLEFIDPDSEEAEEPIPEEILEEIPETEDPVISEEVPAQPEEIPAEPEPVTEELPAGAEFTPVSEWADFLASLKTLEGYAKEFAAENPGEDVNELVINYIRTGVKKYTDGSWIVVAGAERTDFTKFVSNKDTENGTAAGALRGINRVKTLDGQNPEFAHMFGALNIAYICKNAATNSDLGSWAGDLTDLMEFAYKANINTDVDLETLTKDIYDNYLGEDDPSVSTDPDVHGFGMLDMRGDLDSFYLVTKLLGSDRSLSQIMEGYFTADLTDLARIQYFLRYRFPGVNTHEEVRESIYNTYKNNTACQMLESDRGIQNEHLLRQACCYAFADYLYSVAKDDMPPDNIHYEVVSCTPSQIAPGVTQEIYTAITADNKQIAYYVAKADITRDDVKVYANYNGNDPSLGWEMARVTDQMAAAQERHSDPNSELYIPNYNAIVGVNADFYNMSTGEPSGILIMEGKEYHPLNGKNFFAILDDGTAVIGTPSEWDTYKDRVVEAVGGSILLMDDGEILYNNKDSYYEGRASRTCVGITADGEVVLMVLDGRQEPWSAGGTSSEIARIMYEAGCVDVLNIDGGGSTTYAAKPEGSDTVQVINRPSDGYERSVSSSLMIVSTAETSTEFDHALITSDKQYVTPGASIQLNASGVSLSGGKADIPEGAVWEVSDANAASVDENGKLTAIAAAETGKTEVTVSLTVEGTAVGSRKIYIVSAPDEIKFTKINQNVIYGEVYEFPLEARYDGNLVSITPSDVNITLSVPSAGTVAGFTFIANEASGVRSLIVTAALKDNAEVKDGITLALFKKDEAAFEFENATSGQRDFAWNRVVLNAVEDGKNYYHIPDPTLPIDISYIFALDMSVIPMPEKLEDLKGMIAGSDQGQWEDEFGNLHDGANAWTLMLQLAERVNPMTNVVVTFKVDPNLEINADNIKFANDYFELKNPELNEETNELKLTCNFIKQSAAIPANTANPLCIVSGIKATVKDDAAWTDNKLEIVNIGTVEYDVYLRANALYSFACDPANQQQYDLYPFIDTVINPSYNAYDKGGHFAATYVNFEDAFTLDKNLIQGWKVEDGKNYYYVDGEKVTGVYKVPSLDKPTDTSEENMFYYEFASDGEALGKATILFEEGGKKYYAVLGILQDDWRLIPDSNGHDQYYYFDPTTKAAVDGKVTIKGLEYTFKNNILTKGAWVEVSTGRRYYWAGSALAREWREIDGERYYFGWHGDAATGLFWVERGNSNNGADLYYFYEDGRCCSTEGVVVYEGLVHDGDNVFTDKKVVYVDSTGKAIAKGLVKVTEESGEVYYYYFGIPSYAYKDGWYWVTKGNGYVTDGLRYPFDEDYKLLTGVTADEKTGVLYYYVNGVRNTSRDNVGLIKLKDGNIVYVNGINDKATIAVNTDVAVREQATHGLLTAGTYHFNENGYLELSGWNTVEGVTKYYSPETHEPATGVLRVPYPTGYSANAEDMAKYPITGNGYIYTDIEDAPFILKDGVVDTSYTGFVEFEGEKRWAVNGQVIWYAGMVKDGEDIYYFAENGIVTGKEYKAERTNGVLPEGKYTFDTDGKLLKFNGLKTIDGEIYYYENYTRTFKGLVKEGSDYYYINSFLKAVKGGFYYVSKTNDLLPAGMYEFDANGKLLQNKGMVEDSTSGKTHYYGQNFTKDYAGLIEDNGSYYYVNSRFEVVKNGTFYVAKTNGLMAAGIYTFDANGKLVLPSGAAEEVKAEAPAAVVEAPAEEQSNSPVYLNAEGEQLKNGRYYVEETEELPAGVYAFDAEGNVVIEQGICVEGEDIVYRGANGETVYAGLVLHEGDYYYINSDHKAVKDCSFVVTRTNGLLPAGVYEFDAEGKMITK